jgi:3'-phosphoadenosine 5'-phosphosulfate (PAPS) 3'-phosphatase
MFLLLTKTALILLQLIHERIWSQKSVEFKSCEVDLVTETDQQVEQLLISNLKSKFPDHRYAFHISTLYIACIQISEGTRKKIPKFI